MEGGLKVVFVEIQWEYKLGMAQLSHIRVAQLSQSRIINLKAKSHPDLLQDLLPDLYVKKGGTFLLIMSRTDLCHTFYPMNKKSFLHNRKI